MPQQPDWKRVLETGMHFTELRRSQARRVASDLVATGQLARGQLAAAVDELVELSRRRSEELRRVVRTEVDRQLSSLGLVTKRDLAALERRLRANAKPAKKAPAKKGPAKKAPAKKGPVKKGAAKKSASGAAAARRPAVRKAARPAKRTR